MSIDLPPELAWERDGTGREQRHVPALDPESIGIDERRVADWLAFAYAFAGELRYCRLDGSFAGDWRAFLNPHGLAGTELAAEWREVERFLESPGDFAETSHHRRPHFALFLTFLTLLRSTQRELNALTRRHLDFHYRTVLSLAPRPAWPDRVHLLARLAAGSSEALLPAGTLFGAGKDSQGDERFFRSDEDLLVNRAAVRQLRAVFVDRQVTGIREARERAMANHENPLPAMLAIAYGEPLPGDPPPAYRAGRLVDRAFVRRLQQLVAFIGDRLGLAIAEFRMLMRLKKRRLATASEDRRTIDAALAIIGPDIDFGRLAGDIDSLEGVYAQRIRPDVLAFISDQLHLEVDAFVAFMDIRLRVDNDWRIVNALLEKAGVAYRQDPGFVLLPAGRRTSPDFAANFAAALGVPDFSVLDGVFAATDLDGVDAAVQQIEAWFHLPLEELAWLLSVCDRATPSDAAQRPQPAEWDRVDALLSAAHARKVQADRRQSLADLHRGSATQAGALLAMLRRVTGEPDAAVDALLAGVDAYRAKDAASGRTFVAIGAALLGPDSPVFREDDWLAAAEMLELAWRRREGAPPPPERHEWRRLVASEDVTRVQAANAGGTLRWRTFGQSVAAPAREAPPEALVGWAIASPLLCLSEGERRVTLTVVFRREGFDGAAIRSLLKSSGTGAGPADSPFEVHLSTASGWVAPHDPGVEAIDDLPVTPVAPSAPDRLPALRWVLGCAASAPAIAAPSGRGWPMLRLRLRSRWQGDAQGYVTPYPIFRRLIVERVVLEVSVAGLSNLVLENDDGVLAPGRPFAPFGAIPAAGSRFAFAHRELLIKRIDSLDVHLDWMRIPGPSLAEHYRNYPAIEAGGPFAARLSLVDQRLDLPLAESAPLFAGDARQPQAIAIADLQERIDALRPGYAYVAGNTPPLAGGVAAWPRHWRLELNSPDFQHDAYPQVAAVQSIALTRALADSLRSGASAPDPANYRVNPPYTPWLKSFSVDYRCRSEILCSGGESSGSPVPRAVFYGRSDERMVHVHPFGLAEVGPAGDGGDCHFLPAYENQGELYIGLAGISAAQDVALLFQMAEGSADPDLAPQPVEWSCLSGNRWLPLQPGGILADATRGLLEPGIVRFRLPAVEPSTLLPDDCYWLRASVARDCDSLCDTVAIHAQAFLANRIIGRGAGDGFERPLPAGTISRTVDPLPGIAAVSQPYTSFGGRPGESDTDFAMRVSEQLRHRQRAVSHRDYELIVLERFPGVCKVKCLPASATDTRGPGTVAVIVVPDVRGRQPFSPFAPKLAAGQLAAIGEFLGAHAPPLSTISVRNAHYVPVKVRCAVRFMPGCEVSSSRLRLNDELNRFLSPWAYAEGGEVVIGGSVYANAIVDFLERRAGVDYVAELRLFKDEDGSGLSPVPLPTDGSGYRVRCERPDGVLVTAGQHDIDLIPGEVFAEEQLGGIGYMKIELDFIIG